MILHWPKLYWPHHSVEYQRVGFKAKSTIKEAFDRAQYLADLFRMSAPCPKNTLFSRNNPPVDVVAVYRYDAFKDWSKENGKLYRDPNEFVKQTLADLKKEKAKYTQGKDKNKTLITANRDPTTSTR